MKRFCLAVIMVAACVPATQAQDCSNWSNWDLRGTYTMSGNGFVDLSKVLPVPGLPSGAIPVFWLGAHTYDGAGGGTGWVTFNAAGTQISLQLVDFTYSMKSDCSVQVKFSGRIRELGITVGPFPRLMVIVPKPGQLELHMIFVGSAPGKPADAGFDLGVTHRISTQF
jgi:opacity protein-like surface antigen